jgi:hypothetical protein
VSPVPISPRSIYPLILPDHLHLPFSLATAPFPSPSFHSADHNTCIVQTNRGILPIWEDCKEQVSCHRTLWGSGLEGQEKWHQHCC